MTDPWYVALTPPRREPSALLALKAAGVPALWPRWTERVVGRRGERTERTVPLAPRCLFVRFDAADERRWHQVRALVFGEWLTLAELPLTPWFFGPVQDRAVAAIGRTAEEARALDGVAVSAILEAMLNDDGLMGVPAPVVEANTIAVGDLVRVGKVFDPPQLGTVRWVNAIGAKVGLFKNTLLGSELFVEWRWLDKVAKRAPKAPQYGRQRAETHVLVDA